MQNHQKRKFLLATWSGKSVRVEKLWYSGLLGNLLVRRNGWREHDLNLGRRDCIIVFFGALRSARHRMSLHVFQLFRPGDLLRRPNDKVRERGRYNDDLGVLFFRNLRRRYRRRRQYRV